MSYKVAVYTFGSVKPGYNALRFATEDEAREYARDLFSRWTAVREYSIDAADEPVNYAVVDGKLVMVPDQEVQA